MNVVPLPPADDETPDQALSAEELGARAFETWERNFNLAAQGTKPYATTSLLSLDNALNDWMWPGLYVLHGVAGAGKSALASQIAVRAGTPVLYLTCEMTPEQMFTRMAALVTRSALYLLNSKQSDKEWVRQKYTEAAQKLKHVTICDGTLPPPITAQWLLSMARFINMEQGVPPLVIVDSLHAWCETITNGETSEYQSLNSAIMSLRKVISNRNCPVVAISERNRASMASGGLSASRGSGRIEYTADVVLDFTREDDNTVYRPGEPIDVHLKIVKNRFGATGGRIPLKFDPRIMEFTER